MAEYEDWMGAHEARGAPNISVCHVIFQGNTLVLPNGLALGC